MYEYNHDNNPDNNANNIEYENNEVKLQNRFKNNYTKVVLNKQICWVHPLQFTYYLTGKQLH